MEKYSLENLKKILRSLIISCRHSLTIEQLDRDFKKLEGAEIPFYNFGFASLEDFLLSISDTLLVVGSGRYAVVYVISTGKSRLVSKQTNFESSRKITELVPNITNKIQEIFAAPNKFNGNVTPNKNINIPPSKLLNTAPVRYSLNSNRKFEENDNPIDPIDNPITFENINEQICDNLKEFRRASHNLEPFSYNPLMGNNITNNNHCDKNLIYCPSNSLNKSSFVNPQTNNVPLNIKSNLDIPKSEYTSKIDKFLNKSGNSSLIKKNSFTDLQNYSLKIESGFANFGNKIELNKLTRDIIPEDWFGIYVNEVHSPYNFWFHFENDSTILDEIKQKLNDFYSNLPVNDFQFSKAHIEKELLCAAPYLGDWRRGEILETPFNDKVKVFFLDYGTVSHVDVKHIKYLSIEFTNFKRLANRGRLADIKPKEKNWTREATTNLLSMVGNVLLFARVIDIDFEENALSLILMDTNGLSDLQINNALVKKGHANLFRKIKSDNTSQELIRKNSSKQFQGLFPSFDMLEKGHYPSFEEIGHLLKSGVDIDEMQQSNVLWNAKDEELFDLSKRLGTVKLYHKDDTSESSRTENIESIENTVHINKCTNPFFYENVKEISNSSDTQNFIERNRIYH